MCPDDESGFQRDTDHVNFAQSVLVIVNQVHFS